MFGAVNFNEKEMVKLLRRMNHDFLNHFQVIAGYLQLGRSNQAMAHLKEAVDDVTARHNLFRWIYPTAVLLVLSWQLKFFEKAKNLIVQGNTDLQEISVAEDLLVDLLSSLLHGMYAISTAAGGEDWLLKVEDRGTDYVFEIEYLGKIAPEYDWSSVSSKAEGIGCRLEREPEKGTKRLICPKGISRPGAE